MLPEGWKKGTLGDGIKLYSGQHIVASDVTSDQNDHPYLTGPADFLNGSIVTTKFTSKPKVCCKKGDILLTVKGSGTGSSIVADNEYCISRQLMAVRAQSFDPQFVYYILQCVERHYENTADGLIPGISRGDVLNTPIFIPPIEEQEYLSSILISWDFVIALVEKLIRAKWKLKYGFMQQLLSSKRRHTGYSEKWKKYKLGELFQERDEINCSNLPLLSVTGEYGVIPHSETGRKDSSSEDKSKYKRIVPGDIGYNTMRMWQGVSALSSLEGIISPAYTICIPQKEIYGPFAAHLFKFPPMVHLFFRYSQGLVSDTLNLKFDSFSEIKVTIPPVEEQKKIASVLDTADQEIALLKKIIDQFKGQKSGLMQRLLTGQVRIKL